MSINKKKSSEIDQRKQKMDSFEQNTETIPLLDTKITKEEENLDINDKEDIKLAEEGTIFSTFLNLTNNIVGAGILSLPHAFKDASIFGGIFLVILTCFLSVCSIIMIAICCELTNNFSFQELCENLVNKRFSLFFQIIMFIYTSLSSISFLILIGDFYSGNNGIINSFCNYENCTNSLFYKIFSKRQIIVFFVTIIILSPLCLLKNLHSLRHTSLISALSTLFLTIFLILNYFNIENKNTPKNIKYFELNLSLFEAAPIINVAFICQYNAPKYYQEMKERSIKKFSFSVILAFSTCCVIYLTVAIFGYLAFGDEVNGDILNNFLPTNETAILVRLALSLVVTFTYPLAFNAFRLSALSILKQLNYINKTDVDGVFNKVTIFLLLLTLIPGCILTNIAVVLDYKGSLLGACIGFLFSAVFYRKLIEKPCYLKVKSKKFWGLCANLFICWSFISGILGVTVTTYNLIQ